MINFMNIAILSAAAFGSQQTGPGCEPARLHLSILGQHVRTFERQLSDAECAAQRERATELSGAHEPDELPNGARAEAIRPLARFGGQVVDPTACRNRSALGGALQWRLSDCRQVDMDGDS